MLLPLHEKEHNKATNPAHTDSNQATLCRARVDHIEAYMVGRRGPTGQQPAKLLVYQMPWLRHASWAMPLALQFSVTNTFYWTIAYLLQVNVGVSGTYFQPHEDVASLCCV